VVALVLLITAGLSFWSRITTPTDQSVINPEELMSWTAGDVATLQNGTAGALRPNDQVITVEERSISSWVSNLPNLDAKYSSLAVGQTLIYQVQRAGRLQEVPVILQQYPLASKMAHNWSLVLFILEFIVLAIYVFAHRPNDPAAQAALLVAACATCAAPLWMSGLEVADLVTTTGSWRYLLGETADAMTWGASLHFVLIFPRPRPVLIRYPWLAGLVYVAPFILFAAQLATLPTASGGLIRL
jgi:two-component system, NarL family, sensor kinase